MITTKSGMVDYIRNWVHRTSDPSARLDSLMDVTNRDLSVLFVAIQKAEREADQPANKMLRQL